MQMTCLRCPRRMQDAVLKVGDMVYLAEAQDFRLRGQPLCLGCFAGKNARRRSGLAASTIFWRRRRLHPQPVNANTILSLLSMDFVAKDELAGTLTLHFSGGHAVAFDVEDVDVQLDDLGPAWGTELEPSHGASERNRLIAVGD